MKLTLANSLAIEQCYPTYDELIIELAKLRGTQTSLLIDAQAYRAMLDNPSMARHVLTKFECKLITRAEVALHIVAG